MADETPATPPAPPAAPPPAAPAPPPPVATSTPWMEGEGWTPELKADKTLTKYKSPVDLAVAHVNLQKMLGTRVEVPTEKTDPEAAKVFWSKLGVPEDPSGYDAPKVPEGRTLDQDMLQGFQKVAHEAKLTKAGADKLVQWYIERELALETASAQEFAAEKEAGMKALKQEWGAAADTNIGICQRFVAEHGGADVQAALHETGAGNDPRIVKFLSKVGRMMGEEGLMNMQELTRQPADAQQELTKIMNDHKHPYWLEGPGHKEAVEHVARLHELIYNR